MRVEIVKFNGYWRVKVCAQITDSIIIGQGDTRREALEDAATNLADAYAQVAEASDGKKRKK